MSATTATALLPGQVACVPGPVDQTVTHAIDHGLRRDAVALARAVAAVPAGDRRAWRALAARWGWFAEVLELQSSGRTAGVWPLLRGRADADEVRVLDAVDAEQDALRASVALTAELLDRLASDRPDPRSPEDARAAAVVRSAAVRDALLHHLAHVESDAFVVLQRWMSAVEWERVDREFFLARTGPRFLLRLVPWTAHGLPEPAREEVLGRTGPGFRVVLALTRRRFDRAEQRVLGRAG